MGLSRFFGTDFTDYTVFLPSPLDLNDARELFGIVTFLDIYGKALIVIFSSICSRTSGIVTLCANRIDDRLRAEIISYKA